MEPAAFTRESLLKNSRHGSTDIPLATAPILISKCYDF